VPARLEGFEGMGAGLAAGGGVGVFFVNFRWPRGIKPSKMS
jgi:hypothetical protein